MVLFSRFSYVLKANPDVIVLDESDAEVKVDIQSFVPITCPSFDPCTLPFTVQTSDGKMQFFPFLKTREKILQLLFSCFTGRCFTLRNY